MSFLRNAVPASLRNPIESYPIGQSLMARVKTVTVISGPEARAASISKSRFAPMPQEPEDARLTGATRSLNRRLLALNVPGSLRMDSGQMPVAKIA